MSLLQSIVEDLVEKAPTGRKSRDRVEAEKIAAQYGSVDLAIKALRGGMRKAGKRGPGMSQWDVSGANQMTRIMDELKLLKRIDFKPVGEGNSFGDVAARDAAAREAFDANEEDALEDFTAEVQRRANEAKIDNRSTRRGIHENTSLPETPDQLWESINGMTPGLLVEAKKFDPDARARAFVKQLGSVAKATKYIKGAMSSLTRDDTKAQSDSHRILAALKRMSESLGESSVFDKPAWVADFKAGWEASKKTKKYVVPDTAYKRAKVGKKHGISWIDGYAAWIDVKQGATNTSVAQDAKKMGLIKESKDSEWEAKALGRMNTREYAGYAKALEKLLSKLDQAGVDATSRGIDIEAEHGGKTLSGEVKRRSPDGSWVLRVGGKSTVVKGGPKEMAVAIKRQLGESLNEAQAPKMKAYNLILMIGSVADKDRVKGEIEGIAKDLGMSMEQLVTWATERRFKSLLGGAYPTSGVKKDMKAEVDVLIKSGRALGMMPLMKKVAAKMQKARGKRSENLSDLDTVHLLDGLTPDNLFESCLGAGTLTQLDEAKKVKFAPGDIVKWTAKFMRNTGQVSGPVDGMVIETPSKGSFIIVMWSDDNLPSNVHPGNLQMKKKGPGKLAHLPIGMKKGSLEKLKTTGYAS